MGKIEDQIREKLENLYYNDTDVWGNVSFCCHVDEVDKIRDKNSDVFVAGWEAAYDYDTGMDFEEYMDGCKSEHDETFMIPFDDDFELQYLTAPLNSTTEMAAPIAEEILELYKKYEDEEATD
jgi:hypothetical protein